jgi:hypothetical protein
MRVERIGSRVERGFGASKRNNKIRSHPSSLSPLSRCRSLAPESPGPGATRHSPLARTLFSAPSHRTYIYPAHLASDPTHSRRFLDPVARLHGPCCAPAARVCLPPCRTATCSQHARAPSISCVLASSSPVDRFAAFVAAFLFRLRPVMSSWCQEPRASAPICEAPRRARVGVKNQARDQRLDLMFG